MSRLRERTTATLLIAIFMISIFIAPMLVFANDIVEVNQLGDDGWILWDIRHNGIVDFVPGPDTPPLGVGSLRLACTINNPDKAGVAKLGDFGPISGISGYYNWYRTSSTNGFQAPAFKLGVDIDETEGYDMILVYEPYFQPGFDPNWDNVWRTEPFNMDTNGKWWLWIVGVGSVGQSYAGVKTLSEWLSDGTYGAALQGGDIVALLFEVGSWNADTDGYVDDFYISILDYRTDFDYEHEPEFIPKGSRKGWVHWVWIEVEWDGDTENMASWYVYAYDEDENSPNPFPQDWYRGYELTGTDEGLDYSGWTCQIIGNTLQFDEEYVSGVIAHPQVNHVVLHDYDGDGVYTGSETTRYEFPTRPGYTFLDVIIYEIHIEEGEVVYYYYEEHEYYKYIEEA